MVVGNQCGSSLALPCEKVGAIHAMLCAGEHAWAGCTHMHSHTHVQVDMGPHVSGTPVVMETSQATSCTLDISCHLLQTGACVGYERIDVGYIFYPSLPSTQIPQAMFNRNNTSLPSQTYCTLWMCNLCIAVTGKEPCGSRMDDSNGRHIRPGLCIGSAHHCGCL